MERVGPQRLIAEPDITRGRIMNIMGRSIVATRVLAARSIVQTRPTPVAVMLVMVITQLGATAVVMHVLDGVNALVRPIVQVVYRIIVRVQTVVGHWEPALGGRQEQVVMNTRHHLIVRAEA